MIVKAVRDGSIDPEGFLAAIQLPQDQVFISVSKEYEVYAMSVFDGVITLLIIDDWDIPTWMPSWFFQTIDPSIPADWICNLFDFKLQAVFGPDYIARDEVHYSQMVEGYPDPTDEFWRRIGPDRSIDPDLT